MQLQPNKDICNVVYTWLKRQYQNEYSILVHTQNIVTDLEEQEREMLFLWALKNVENHSLEIFRFNVENDNLTYGIVVYVQ